LASEIDEEIVDQLKRSKEILGEIIPIIVDDDGNILSGRHRERAGWTLKHRCNIDAIVSRLNCSASMAREIVRLHCNVQRKPSKEETKAILLRIAKELELKGVEKKSIAGELKKYVPFSDRYIEELLPDEYKKIEHRPKGEPELVRVLSKSTSNKPRASSPRASEFLMKADTEAEQLLVAHLSRRGVNFLTQVPFVRESENKDGIQKTYVVDILVDGIIAIECEGEGSSSRDSSRDSFFSSKGIKVFHIPNECIIKYADVIADLIAYIASIKK
jgi:very-short-patch-repair endonuclease